MRHRYIILEEPIEKFSFRDARSSRLFHVLLIYNWQEGKLGVL